MAGDAHAVDIDKHVRVYILVFVSLMVLTLVTVAVSYLHLPVPLAIGVALLIATVKGSLVACYFMHLISEKKLIYAVLLLTVVFFIGLLILPVVTQIDGVEGAYHTPAQPAPAATDSGDGAHH